MPPGRQRRKKRNGKRREALPLVPLVDNPLNFMPTRFSRRLRFQTYVNVNQAGFSFANKRFTPTYAYDVDPALGSTAVPGFTELTAIYLRYRVRRFRYQISAVNLDAVSAMLCVCPVNVDPGTNVGATRSAYWSSRRAKTSMMGLSTGNSKTQTLSGWVSIEDFAGVKWTGQFDAYTGTGSTSPTNNVWLFVGGESGAAMTLGIDVNLILDLDIDFFELVNPSG